MDVKNVKIVDSKVAINVPISNGELVDKVTILEIKLRNINDIDKRFNIQYEFNELSLLMSDLYIKKTSEEYKSLLEVNNELWQIEDNIREKERKKEFDAEFIELARSVYRLNDKRAELKRLINLKFNSTIIEEKSYSKY